MSGLRVGDIVRVQRAEADEYLVVLAGGVQRIGLVAADLILFGSARTEHQVADIAPAASRQVPMVSVLPVSEFPDRIGPPRGADIAVVCASWASGVVSLWTGAELPLDGHRVAVPLAQADGGGSAVDAVFLPPGRSAYVRAPGSPESAGWVVADTGVRFAVGDPDAARTLGLPDTAELAPWPLVMMLPAGPELRRDAALVARDVVAPGPP
jgi:hypothetical protein